MENYYNISIQLSYAREIIKKNEILFEKHIKRQERLKFKTDMLLSRLDFVIEAAKNMRKGE